VQGDGPSLRVDADATRVFTASHLGRARAPGDDHQRHHRPAADRRDIPRQWKRGDRIDRRL